MIVFRVAQKRFASDLSGEGARLYGGRWNHILTPCIYTADSRALALLEFSVNVDAKNISKELVMLSLEVPEDNFMQLKIDKLPSDWNSIPPNDKTRNLGNLILNESDLSVIGVPSSVVPEEWNFLLNPRNMPAGWPKILDFKEIGYDFRIKK